jgi:hypothetical protein
MCVNKYKQCVAWGPPWKKWPIVSWKTQERTSSTTRSSCLSPTPSCHPNYHEALAMASHHRTTIVAALVTIARYLPPNALPIGTTTVELDLGVRPWPFTAALSSPLDSADAAQHRGMCLWPPARCRALGPRWDQRWRKWEQKMVYWYIILNIETTAYECHWHSVA